jgi:hypothetical protein
MQQLVQWRRRLTAWVWRPVDPGRGRLRRRSAAGEERTLVWATALVVARLVSRSLRLVSALTRRLWGVVVHIDDGSGYMRVASRTARCVSVMEGLQRVLARLLVGISHLGEREVLVEYMLARVAAVRFVTRFRSSLVWTFV